MSGKNDTNLEIIYTALCVVTRDFLGDLPPRAVPILRDLAGAMSAGDEQAISMCRNQFSLLIQRAKTRKAKMPSYLLREYGDDVARVIVMAILSAFNVQLP